MPLTRSTFASAVLISHAESPDPVICGINAKVDGSESGALTVSYTLIADVHQLLVPVSAAPRRIDGLWRHTCFEMFLGMQDGPTYYEFNFAPSREWAAYRFRAYRDGGPIENEVVAPSISVEQLTDRLTLTATIRIDRLPLIQPGQTLHIGLSAVIEAADGSLSYWALKHPSERPDFHHPSSFAMELDLPDRRA